MSCVHLSSLIVLSKKYYRFGENGGRIFSDCILFLSNFILIVRKEGGCDRVEGLLYGNI